MSTGKYFTCDWFWIHKKIRKYFLLGQSGLKSNDGTTSSYHFQQIEVRKKRSRSLQLFDFTLRHFQMQLYSNSTQDRGESSNLSVAHLCARPPLLGSPRCRSQIGGPRRKAQHKVRRRGCASGRRHGLCSRTRRGDAVRAARLHPGRRIVSGHHVQPGCL